YLLSNDLTISGLSICIDNPLPPHSFPTRRSSDLTREQVDEYASQSFAKAVAAQASGFHAGEIVAVVSEKFELAGYQPREFLTDQDRKSTRLNSSHSQISYAVFCLKKKNAIIQRAAPLRPCLPSELISRPNRLTASQERQRSSQRTVWLLLPCAGHPSVFAPQLVDH